MTHARVSNGVSGEVGATVDLEIDAPAPSAANPDAANPDVAAKLAALERRLGELDSLLVCYSGGVDSALLLAVAHQMLGAGAIGMTAVSPSLAESEREQAVAIAREIGAAHRLVDSHELEDRRYARNEPDRCFYCKSELYRLAELKRQQWGLAAVANGANLDDLGDYRPGLQAAREAGVLSPLCEVGFRKADVRAVAQRIGLRIWDKPAAACLSSRLPYGTEVTAERLAQVARLEGALQGLGFKQVRVRHHGAVARIEVGLDELGRAAEPARREAIVEAGQQSGFQYVTLDLGGYRMGSHNELLDGNKLRIVG